MERIKLYWISVKKWYRGTNHTSLFITCGSITASLILVVLMTVLLPNWLRNDKAKPVVEAALSPVETELQTVAPETSAITEQATEATTISPDESKKVYKVDKNVRPNTGSGDRSNDQDNDGLNKGDKGEAPAPTPPLVAPPDSTPPEEDSKITNLSYVATSTLTGWQKIGGNHFYFNDNHELLNSHQSINGVRYFFNDYGAKASKIGIDVSNHNGTIDWKKVKASGVDYAIIRVGFRGYGTDTAKGEGVALLDKNFEKNIQGAIAAGVQVGVYFYSQAITIQEAIEEASIAVNYAGKYKLTYPIYFDTEYATSDRIGRADKLSKSARTDITIAFCETVRNAGFKAGVYASKSFFDDELVFSRISSYNIWVAHYTKDVTNFKHPYKMWQYTDKGRVDGIPGNNGNVDLNISLYDYAANSSMKNLGQDVIFANTSEELKPFLDAEKAIEAYQTEKSFNAYLNATAMITTVPNNRVQGILFEKLAEIKKKIESETTQAPEPTTQTPETTTALTTQQPIYLNTVSLSSRTNSKLLQPS